MYIYTYVHIIHITSKLNLITTWLCLNKAKSGFGISLIFLKYFLLIALNILF